jgi:hypothetical protein
MLNLAAKQLNWLCTVPFEVTSSVNQLTPGSPGLLPTARRLYSEGGLGVFYRGLTVSLVLAVNPAIMSTLITSLLSLHARLKTAWGTDYHDAREHSAAAIGAATALSKAAATFLTYPLIRSKVLQQTMYRDKSIPQILKMVIAGQGMKGLYQGVLSMRYKTVLWNSLMMVFKHILGPKRVITPLTSPVAAQRLPSKISMFGREPFPAELVTVERLDEMLQKLNWGGTQNHRMERIEQRLEDVGQEMRELRTLLTRLVNSERPVVSAKASPPDKEVP